MATQTRPGEEAVPEKAFAELYAVLDATTKSTGKADWFTFAGRVLEFAREIARVAVLVNPGLPNARRSAKQLRFSPRRTAQERVRFPG